MGKGECKPPLNLLHPADRSQDSCRTRTTAAVILEGPPELINLVLGLQLERGSELAAFVKA